MHATSNGVRTGLIIAAALLAPLILPWWLALPLVALASVAIPPVGLLAGVLTDALYLTREVGVPYATVLGLLLAVAGFFVHRFIKTRIMRA